MVDLESSSSIILSVKTFSPSILISSFGRTIEKGMVFTCEPGIYIPEEQIGCRLENDYLITKDGNINLTEAMPIEIDDIESLMNS